MGTRTKLGGAKSGGLSPLPFAINPGEKFRAFLGNFTFSASYPTGGEAIDLSDFLAGGNIQMFFSGKGANTFEYDATNAKIKVFVSSSAAEVANATDLSAVTVRFIAIGQSK